MKKFRKVWFLICVLLISLCTPVYADIVTEYAGGESKNYEDYSQKLYGELMEYDEEKMDDAISFFNLSNDALLEKSYTNLKEMYDLVKGSNAEDFVMETISEGGCVLSTKQTYSNDNGKFVFEIKYNEDLQIMEFSFTKETITLADRIEPIMNTLSENILLTVGILIAVGVVLVVVIVIRKRSHKSKVNKRGECNEK